MNGGKPIRRRVATVGTFDGLHRGHRKVLDTVTTLSKETGSAPLVICFDRHPLETVAPERAPGLIQSPSERTNTLFREGFEILTIEFSHAMASLTAREWLTNLRDKHEVDTIVIGYDNTFGCDGVGMSIEDYVDLGRSLGIKVVEAPMEKGISSSAIRKHLEAGRLEEATAMLGRPYTLTGKVVHGRHLGSRLGFPTANLQLSYKAQLPADGVYAADALLPDGSRRRAVVNIGKCPTVDQCHKRTVEAHIIGLDEDLYNERLSLKIIRRLRDEKKFDSLTDLTAQIRRDIKEALKSET